MIANKKFYGQKRLPNVRHVYHIYAIRTSNRDALRNALMEKGVQTGVHYPIPVHLQKGFEDLGYRIGDYPHSEQAAAEVLSLPMYAELTDDQIHYVAKSLIDSFKKL